MLINAAVVIISVLLTAMAVTASAITIGRLIDDNDMARKIFRLSIVLPISLVLALSSSKSGGAIYLLYVLLTVPIVPLSVLTI